MSFQPGVQLYDDTYLHDLYLQRSWVLLSQDVMDIVNNSFLLNSIPYQSNNGNNEQLYYSIYKPLYDLVDRHGIRGKLTLKMLSHEDDDLLDSLYRYDKNVFARRMFAVGNGRGHQLLALILEDNKEINKDLCEFYFSHHNQLYNRSLSWDIFNKYNNKSVIRDILLLNPHIMDFAWEYDLPFDAISLNSHRYIIKNTPSIYPINNFKSIWYKKILYHSNSFDVRDITFSTTNNDEVVLFKLSYNIMKLSP